jgi:hypothetical protein
MKFKYTLEALDAIVERDHAVLISNHIKIQRRHIIIFRCHCGEEYRKTARILIRHTGAFCKKCTMSHCIEKTKSTIASITNKTVLCTLESLHSILQRDHALLLDEYASITNNTIIHFRCNCNHESEKNCLQLISVSGAFCEKCTRITWTRKIKETNIERYGVECTAQAAVVKEKIIQSNLEKYGVENVFESKEIRDKCKQTCFERYGVEHPAQSQEVMEKTQKNAKKYKEYKMPSGNSRKVQGYEPFALDELIKIYQEDNIITDRKEIPRITYMINDKKKYYFPDIFIKNINTIIEVKSTWTYQSKKDNVHEKESATKMAGYKYEIWVYDRKGNKI